MGETGKDGSHEGRRSMQQMLGDLLPAWGSWRHDRSRLIRPTDLPWVVLVRWKMLRFRLEQWSG